MIEKLLKEIELSGDNKFKTIYEYNGQPVPRVTEILSTMLHEEYLMRWANVLGLYKRQKYETVRDEAAYIGTATHDMIEQHIQNEMFIMNLSDEYNAEQKKKITNGVNSFLLWYNNLKENNTITVLGLEQRLSCPWFGGTYDMLININGKTYLTDFKTSNYISYKYFLQLGAYKYMLNLQGIQIDGTIILQVDKNEIAYEEYVLSFDNPQHLEYINLCTNAFLSLVYSYYNKLQVEKNFNTIFNKK